MIQKPKKIILTKTFLTMKTENTDFIPFWANEVNEKIENSFIPVSDTYPNDKFDPLRKIFFQVAALLCDIKRNVRHAALECIAVIYSKLKQTDKQIGSLLDQLDVVSEFQHFDNLNIIKDVIMCRVSRNKLPVLNPDMTIEYAIKIPSTIKNCF